MSNFTYERYLEIVNDLEEIINELKEADNKNYNSQHIESLGRDLISSGNSLIMYIRHYKTNS